MSCSRGRRKLSRSYLLSRGPSLKSVPKTKVILKNGKEGSKISPIGKLARTNIKIFVGTNGQSLLRRKERFSRNETPIERLHEVQSLLKKIYLRISHIFRENQFEGIIKNYIGNKESVFLCEKIYAYRYSTFRSCLIKFQNCLTLKSKSPFQNLARIHFSPNFRSKAFRNFQERMFSNSLLAESTNPGWPGYFENVVRAAFQT